MTRLKESIFINAPVDKVDDLVRDPHRWTAFFVGAGEPEKVTGDGGPGTVVEGSGTLFWGIHVHDTTKVIEERHEADGTHWCWEVTGPVGWRLTCHHEPQEGGTLVSSESDYALPWSVLGQAADRLFFERAQRRDMHRTLENLKRLLEEPETLGGRTAS